MITEEMQHQKEVFERTWQTIITGTDEEFLNASDELVKTATTTPTGYTLASGLMLWAGLAAIIYIAVKGTKTK